MSALEKKLREFLRRAEKGSALLLNYEFDELQKEIEEYLLSIAVDDRHLAIEQIDDILDEIQKALSRRTVRFASVVEQAQKRVIRSTAETLTAELKTVFKNKSIVRTDRPAIKKLIGRSQDGGTLTQFFQRLEPYIREEARDALIEGFSRGDSSDQIARRLNEVTNIGKVRALTISRTETNEAYRSASREFYDDAGIEKYVWMSATDPRTCIICWWLHGQQFNSSKKVLSHPQCRCVMLPVTDGMAPIEFGEDLFAKLEPGYQKQTLGKSRFALYQAGARLSDFIGSKQTEEFGETYFIRPLIDLEEGSGSRSKGHFFINEDISPYSPEGKTFGQSDKYSCVPCSVKMILDDNGVEIPEAFIRGELKTDEDGTPLSRAVAFLNDQLPDKEYIFKRKAVIDDLFTAPSIVNVRTKTDVHSVVVDRIDSGKVYLRDPLPEGQGKAYALELEAFKKYWLFRGKEHGLAVIIKQ